MPRPARSTHRRVGAIGRHASAAFCPRPGGSCHRRGNSCRRSSGPCRRRGDPCRCPVSPCRRRSSPSHCRSNPCRRPTLPCRDPSNPCRRRGHPCGRPIHPCSRRRRPCRGPSNPCRCPRHPCRRRSNPCRHPRYPCRHPSGPCGFSGRFSLRIGTHCGLINKATTIQIFVRKGKNSSILPKNPLFWPKNRLFRVKTVIFWPKSSLDGRLFWPTDAAIVLPGDCAQRCAVRIHEIRRALGDSSTRRLAGMGRGLITPGYADRRRGVARPRPD